MNPTINHERAQDLDQWLAQAFHAERGPQRPARPAAAAASYAMPAAAARGYYWSMLAVSLLTWAIA